MNDDRAGRRRRRRGTGEVYPRPMSSGDVAWYARITFRGSRPRVILGYASQGMDRAQAETKLANIVVLREAGHWQPQDERSEADAPIPTFHYWASAWLQRKAATLKPNTHRAYREALTLHLLPAFKHRRLDEFDFPAVDRYVERKQRLGEQIAAAKTMGQVLRNPVTRSPLRPLSARTINSHLDLLAQILDEAIKRKLIDQHAARDPQLRMKVPRNRHDILDLDELRDLLAAASAIDKPTSDRVEQRRCQARELRNEGMSPKEIASRLGVAEPTVYYYLKPAPPAHPAVRHAIIATLALTGLRSSELCALDTCTVDVPGGNLRVVDAKTDAGVRRVDICPALTDILSDYRLSRLAEVDDDRPFFPTRSGARRDKDNINARVIRPAVRVANDARARRSRPPLPTKVSAHTLRRTFISLMLAKGEDPRLRDGPGRPCRQQGHTGDLQPRHPGARPRSSARRDPRVLRRRGSQGLGSVVAVGQNGRSRRPLKRRPRHPSQPRDIAQPTHSTHANQRASTGIQGR